MGIFSEETALHLAARCNRVNPIVKMLEHHNFVEVNAQDADGNTPLHAAVAINSLTIVQTLLKFPAIDIDIQNDEGFTALNYAAKLDIGDMHIVDLLLKRVASNCINMQDNEGLHTLVWLH